MNVLVREATSTKDPNGTSPIVSVSAAITTDTGIKTYPLSLTSGTNLDGGWYGSWVVHDTHVAKYFTTFTAKTADLTAAAQELLLRLPLCGRA